MLCRQAQWHADKAVRLHTPAVETALLLKCQALLALGKHAEALNETRSLTIQGDPMATEVLTIRAQALYLTGTVFSPNAMTAFVLKRVSLAKVLSQTDRYDLLLIALSSQQDCLHIDCLQSTTSLHILWQCSLALLHWVTAVVY